MTSAVAAASAMSFFQGMADGEHDKKQNDNSYYYIDHALSLLCGVFWSWPEDGV